MSSFVLLTSLLTQDHLSKLYRCGREKTMTFLLRSSQSLCRSEASKSFLSFLLTSLVSAPKNYKVIRFDYCSLTSRNFPEGFTMLQTSLHPSLVRLCAKFLQWLSAYIFILTGFFLFLLNWGLTLKLGLFSGTLVETSTFLFSSSGVPIAQIYFLQEAGNLHSL